MQYSTHLARHFHSIVGNNIHRLRRGKKLTLKKLARETAIFEELLDQYELGKNELRLRELIKIACILEVEVAELIK